jgi:hypothetical protein
VLNATFSNISVISWRSVLLGRKPQYPEKTTDLPQVTDNLGCWYSGKNFGEFVILLTTSETQIKWKKALN